MSQSQRVHGKSQAQFFRDGPCASGRVRAVNSK